ALSRPNISVDLQPVPGGYKLALATDRLARAVCLSLDGMNASFSDNYFDLVPGQPVEVLVRPQPLLDIGEVRRRLRVRSLVDAFSVQ
ncbi:hypothetical protein OFL98_28545, partial [Escherichia coli]|nr:hypothetical protein [Escherichia coli]